MSVRTFMSLLGAPLRDFVEGIGFAARTLF